MPIPTWLVRMLGTSAGRYALAMLPKWLERRWYPDAKLAKDIRLRGMLEPGEGATLRLETIFGVPRLVARLAVENHSFYRTVSVDRLVGSIARVVDLTYEGWAAETLPAGTMHIDVALTSEQAVRLRDMVKEKPDLEIKITAKLLCDGRPVRKTCDLTAKLHV